MGAGKQAIFLSYTSADADFVDRLASDLERAGLDVWHFKRDLLPGTPIWHRINTEIYQRKCVGVVLSGDSIRSSGVKAEIRSAYRLFGQSEDLFLIPILKASLEQRQIPHELKGITWADFSRSYRVGLRELLRAFSVDLSGPSHEATEAIIRADTLHKLIAESFVFLRRLSNVDYVQLALMGDDTHETRSVVVADSIPPGQFRYRLVSRTGLIGLCLKSGNVVLDKAVKSNPDYLCAEPSTEAEMVIPIVAVRFGLIGAINIETETPDFFDKIDTEELKAIADLIADVIETRDWLPVPMDQLPSIWVPGKRPKSASDIELSPDAFAASIEHIQQTHDRLGHIPEYHEVRTKGCLLHAKYVAVSPTGQFAFCRERLTSLPTRDFSKLWSPSDTQPELSNGEFSRNDGRPRQMPNNDLNATKTVARTRLPLAP